MSRFIMINTEVEIDVENILSDIDTEDLMAELIDLSRRFRRLEK